MSLLRRIDALEPFCSPPFFSSSSSESSSSFSSSIFAPQTLIHPPLLQEAEEAFFALDHITHCPYTYYPTPLELFDTLTDLILTPPPPPRSFRSCKRFYRRLADHDPFVDLLCDRFERLVICRGGGTHDRKYKWTADIEGKYVDRKYKWTEEIKEKERAKEKLHHHLHHYHHHDYDCYHYYDQGKEERNYKWTAEIKEKGLDGPVKRTYTWKTTIGGAEGKEKEKEKNKKNKKKKEECRLVEIVEPNDHVILRQLESICMNFYGEGKRFDKLVMIGR